VIVGREDSERRRRRRRRRRTRPLCALVSEPELPGLIVELVSELPGLLQL
jgi:hypothetical protein